jgi:hypothetical protein
MIVKRCVRERGIHALHSFGSCCPRRRSRWRERQRAADQTINPPPLVLLGRNRAPAVAFA